MTLDNLQEDLLLLINNIFEKNPDMYPRNPVEKEFLVHQYFNFAGEQVTLNEYARWILEKKTVLMVSLLEIFNLRRLIIYASNSKQFRAQWPERNLLRENINNKIFPRLTLIALYQKSSPHIIKQTKYLYNEIFDFLTFLDQNNDSADLLTIIHKNKYLKGLRKQLWKHLVTIANHLADQGIKLENAQQYVKFSLLNNSSPRGVSNTDKKITEKDNEKHSISAFFLMNAFYICRYLDEIVNAPSGTIFTHLRDVIYARSKYLPSKWFHTSETLTNYITRSTRLKRRALSAPPKISLQYPLTEQVEDLLKVVINFQKELLAEKEIDPLFLQNLRDRSQELIDKYINTFTDLISKNKDNIVVTELFKSIYLTIDNQMVQRDHPRKVVKFKYLWENFNRLRVLQILLNDLSLLKDFSFPLKSQRAYASIYAQLSKENALNTFYRLYFKYASLEKDLINAPVFLNILEIKDFKNKRTNQLSEQFRERIDVIDQYINKIQEQLDKGMAIGFMTYTKLNQRKKRLVSLNQFFKEFTNNFSIVDQLPKVDKVTIVNYIKQMDQRGLSQDESAQIN